MLSSAPNNLILSLAYWNCSHLLQSFIRHLTRYSFDLGLAALGTPSPMKLPVHPLNGFQPQRSQNRKPWQGHRFPCHHFCESPAFSTVKCKEHFYFFLKNTAFIHSSAPEVTLQSLLLKSWNPPKAVQLQQQEMVSRINTPNYLEHSVRHVCYWNRQNKCALCLHSLLMGGLGTADPCFPIHAC